MIVGRRVGWGRRQAIAAAVMLIALSTSLLLLAKPTGRAAADPSTATDISATVAVSCTSSTDDTANQVQVTFTGFNNAPQAGPALVELQLVPNGQTTISTILATGTNVPTYVNVSSPASGTPPFPAVWLNGTVTDTNGGPSADQSVVIQAAGYAPIVTPLPVPATCDPTVTPPIQPTDFDLAALPGASVDPSVLTVSSCNTAADGSSDGTATLPVSITDPNDPANFSTYNAASGMTEIDYGVFATDAAGNVLAPTGLALAAFDSAGNALNIPTLVIPAGGQADDQLWVVGTDGQASTIGTALGTLPDCPVNGPTTAPAPVVPPTTDSDSTTPAAPTSSPADTTTNTTSVSPSVSAPSSPPADTTTPTTTASDSETPPASSTAPPPPASEPVAPVTYSAQNTDTPTAAAVLTPTASSTPDPLPVASVSDLFSASTATSAAPVDESVEASPTSTLSFPAGAKLAPPTNGPLADATSNVKGVQILRWHQDAALVVGFDALAIFSLVGATVWSARRR